MKKIIALALSLTLILCTATVLAEETAEKTRMGTLSVEDAFTIQSKIPENYKFYPSVSNNLALNGVLMGGEEDPTVTIQIAYSEEYTGVERLNDVDEAAMQEIRDSFQEMDEVEFKDLETAYGTRLLLVTQANKSFADIYTVYKGYELEFIMTAPGGVKDENIQMLVDFISDMDFVPAE